MVERLTGIVGRVADVVRIPRSGERKRKSEPPLSRMEKVPFEKHCQQILEKEDFGREDFGNFCRNMISLCRKEDDPKGFARLRDRKAELDIDFNEDTITMRGNPVATDDPHVFGAGFYGRIYYSPQKTEYGFFGDKISDFQPFLTTHDNVLVSGSIEFFSYFKGKQEPAFPKGIHRVDRHEKVQDKDVQDFCKRVYTVYTLDKVGLNFPPR